jgi:hypothetical protein
VLFLLTGRRASFNEGSRAALVRPGQQRKETMATATQSIALFVTLETANARAHGDGYDIAKAEITALNEIIKTAKAQLSVCQDEAVDQGFAERKEIWTEEHTVKGHFKRRFTWRVM